LWIATTSDVFNINTSGVIDNETFLQPMKNALISDFQLDLDFTPFSGVVCRTATVVGSAAWFMDCVAHRFAIVCGPSGTSRYSIIDSGTIPSTFFDGVYGSFTSQDGHTVTVKGGIITGIV
jgi:hypothetical protein